MTALLSSAAAAAAAAPPPPPTVAALTAEGGWTSSYTASQWLDTPALEVGLGSALLLCCVVCCSLQFYTWRVRRKKLEERPLLAAPSPPTDWEADGGVVQIGIPAREFVRLSSLPHSAGQRDADRCLACGEVGRCVALRPCGHVVLCRSCSDYVCTCPRCSQYITGVGLRPLPARPSPRKT